MAKRPRAPASGTSQASVLASEQKITAVKETTSIRKLLVDIRVRRALYLVLLAAFYSPLSQLVLSPVYGSIPSAVYHKYGVIASAMLAFPLKGHVPDHVRKYFAAFVFWIPTIQFGLFYLSSTFGNPLGPLITECLTTYPLIILSLESAGRELESLDLPYFTGGVREAFPAMYNYFLLTILQRILQSVVPMWIGMNKFFTRIGFQMLIAATYMGILPGSAIWPALPAVAFTAVGNLHTPLSRTTDLLQSTLALYNYTLIERRESNTGYISVLEDNQNKFRVMRCDHSLLGGEWIMPEDTAGKRKVAEPVYAVFTMLEAVRLVQREAQTGTQKALNIGLGVGTAPAALLAHGIETTIIELDPVVHEFATNHFNLPRNHTAWIGDAVAVLESVKDQRQAHYDYIIHDVFTGGAEPVDLFTIEFLTTLNSILKEDGVIAINYAGDLALSSTSLVYRTILEVFPSCRVFREDEQIDEDDIVTEDANGEFTNMVFICNKHRRQVTFRKVIEADFLGSASRKAYMVPRFEVSPTKFQRVGNLLTRSNRRVLEKMHVQSAIGHWKLMRKVMPAAIWENW